MLNQTRLMTMNVLTHDCGSTARRCASVSPTSRPRDINSTYCASSPSSVRCSWRWNVAWRCRTSPALSTTWLVRVSSPVSIQTQSLALRTLHLDGNKQQPIGCSVEVVATMIGRLPTQALAFSPVSIQSHATHATQAIAFGWKPGFSCTEFQFQPIRKQHGSYFFNEVITTVKSAAYSDR